MLAVVLHDDLNLLGDVVGVEPDPFVQSFARLVLEDFLTIALGAILDQLVRNPVRNVVLQGIQDKTFLDSLAHRVGVEWPFDAFRIGASEELQRLALGSGGKGVE